MAHGGQNPIEPAYFKRPILFGPYVFNFSDIYERLETARAARKIADSNSFYEAASFYLSSPVQAKAMGEKAFSIVQEMRGSTNRNIDIVANFLRDHRELSTSREEVVHVSHR